MIAERVEYRDGPLESGTNTVYLWSQFFLPNIADVKRVLIVSRYTVETSVIVPRV